MRSCGPCTACCTVMGVDEISKPANVACDKLCAAGCSIYETRPSGCSEFSCVWLTDETLLRNMERPDLIGVMLDVTDPDYALGSDILVARETRPGAFDEPEANKMMRRLTKKGLVVFVRGDDHAIDGPKHLLEKVNSKESL